MKFFFAAMIFTCCVLSAAAQGPFERDVFKTSSGDLEITFIGHGSLMMRFNGKVIHVDPFGRLTDYAKLPKADVILVTHDHQDHLDPGAISSISTNNTVLVITEACAKKGVKGIVMKNGDVQPVLGIRVEAVPAYNLAHKRENGQPYHPQGQGNGYVLTFGDKRVYIAGDTENTPEMKRLQNIDIAFLPMNLPYTMTPEMVADGAKAFKPKVLYPYHYGETDVSLITGLLKTEPGIDVRIRSMK